MSTRSSLVYIEIQKQPAILHVYYEMQDNCYYLETDEGRIKIPNEIIAKKIVKAIKEGTNSKKECEQKK